MYIANTEPHNNQYKQNGAIKMSLGTVTLTTPREATTDVYGQSVTVTITEVVVSGYRVRSDDSIVARLKSFPDMIVTLWEDDEATAQMESGITSDIILAQVKVKLG